MPATASRLTPPPIADAKSHDQAEHLLIRLLKLASIINRPMLEAVADPNGLSLNEIRIIACLANEGPRAGRDITLLMGMPAMNVSRAVANLEMRGLVEIMVDPANRRRRPVHLTATGRHTYHALEQDMARVAQQMLGGFARRDLDELDRLTGVLLERVEQWRPGE